MVERTLFGSWQPDQPAHLNEGLVTCDGVYPIKNGYAPVRGFVPVFAGGLSSTCWGGTAYRVAGNTYSFAASATEIIRYLPTQILVLASGLDNALGVRTAVYSTLMLFTNGKDAVKKFTPAPNNVVSDLGGSPPVARYIGVVGGFTVLAYASNSPLRVAWSNQGNPEQWTPSTTSEAGVFDMATGGDITGFVGGEYGLIFQESRIVRMTYTGADTVWQFDEIATDVGCVIPGTIATWGKLTFFRSARGFMMCDGSSVTPIGEEQIDRWFQGQVDRSYFPNTSAVVDPTRSLYVVTVPNGVRSNTLLIYNWSMQKWTTATIQVERLFQGLSQDVTLDDLDAIYSSLDTVNIPMDSDVFRSGAPLLFVVDPLHRLGVLADTPLQATFVDAKREFVPSRKARLRRVRPITDATAPVFTVSGSNVLSESGTPQQYTRRQANGSMPVRESWNYMQMTLTIPPQEWTYAQGYDYEIALGGRA